MINKMIKKKTILLSVLALLLVPTVLAYSVGLEMPSLWDVFVEWTFGSFWVSVIGLMAIFYIIVGLIGRCSGWTVLTFDILFLLSMSIGYGFALLTVILWSATMLWSVFNILQFLNTSSR